MINHIAGDITIKVPGDLTACMLDLGGSSIEVDSQLNCEALKLEEKDGRVCLRGN